MAHNVIKIARTKWGNVRVGIPINRWEDANNPGSSRREVSRQFICIKIKRRLNAEGAQVSWVNWKDIQFQDIDSPPAPIPTPQEQFDSQVEAAVAWAVEQSEIEEAPELFPGFFGQQPVIFNSEVGCGCVPSRITAR